MKSLRLLLFLIIPFLSGAQSVKGYIYDAGATIKGAKLINKTQNILSYSNDKGYFKIEAKLNDVIVVTSLFHSEKTITITQSYLDEEVVIELKKITNELDEVEVTNVVEKKFDSIVSKSQIQIQIANDIKNRPWLYGEQPSSNIDFIAIGRLIGKLFKNKNKVPQIEYLETEDLITLFEKNPFFNQSLLISELKIPKDLQYLFFELCITKNIDKKIISEQRDMELLDQLVLSSKEFHALLKEHQKD